MRIVIICLVLYSTDDRHQEGLYPNEKERHNRIFASCQRSQEVIYVQYLTIYKIVDRLQYWI